MEPWKGVDERERVEIDGRTKIFWRKSKEGPEMGSRWPRRMIGWFGMVEGSWDGKGVNQHEGAKAHVLKKGFTESPMKNNEELARKIEKYGRGGQEGMMDEVGKFPRGLERKIVTQWEEAKGNESKEGSTEDLIRIHKELAKKFNEDGWGGPRRT